MDFSAETERTLQVLDCAILVISATDGIQAHTRTLWRLLERYGIPVFLFVNKMDLPNPGPASLLDELKSALNEGCVDFTQTDDLFYENIATCSESALDVYLENGTISEEELLQQVGNGVYINNLGGLHAGANPISGDFSLQSAGFMIRDGKKAEHVKSFTVAGNFYTLLENIVALADNCQLPMAMGMTAFGAPSVLVEGLSVAGK